ncbi:TetR/AcrR family transcriptional regulator (plasmid) [Streptomyces sp. BI20]|uniref:TetR/AcrR family transcriptional regulator n=1 Tax=Streptomyces sp. BI20 TaxID=3403460 RepID=UPI003C7598DE
MPKKVDHEARRQEIAEALWRIATARGLDDVSLRDVAAEAGISLGRLQHYFRSKDEMLLFALRHVNVLAERRIRERIEGAAVARGRAPGARELLRECLLGLLPLDEHSRVGNLVGVAWLARAMHDERLAAEAREGVPALTAFLGDLARAARAEAGTDEGAGGSGVGAAAEGALLLATVDGLTTYTLLGVHTPDEAVALLDAHLARVLA